MFFQLTCSNVPTRTDTTKDTTVKTARLKWSSATTAIATTSNKTEGDLGSRTGATEAMITIQGAPQSDVVEDAEGGHITTEGDRTDRIIGSSIIIITGTISRIEIWEQIVNFPRDSSKRCNNNRQVHILSLTFLGGGGLIYTNSSICGCLIS